MSKNQQDEAIKMCQSPDIMRFLHYKTKFFLKKTKKEKISKNNFFSLLSMFEQFLNTQGPENQKDTVKKEIH